MLERVLGHLRVVHRDEDAFAHAGATTGSVINASPLVVAGQRV
jgi:hypothetical protein